MRSGRCAAWLAAALAGCLTGWAWAGPRTGVPRVLIAPDLSRTSVEVLSLDAERIEVRSAVKGKSKATFVAMRDVLAVLPDGVVEQGLLPLDRDKDAPMVVRLTLTDGECFSGTLPGVEAGAAKSEDVRFEISALGTVRVPLTRVAELSTGLDAGEAVSRGKDDVVALANGDRIAGFVAGVAGGESAGVSVEAGGKTQTIELGRVGRIVFANEPERAAGSMLWLSSGVTLRVKGVKATPASAGFAGVEYTAATLTGEDGKALEGSASLESVAAYVREASGLVALATLKPPSVTPGPGRRWSPGVTVVPARVRPLGLADVELPGPLSAEWELPAGARRISAGVELPAAAREWGECTVVVEVSSPSVKELARVKLDGEHAAGSFNAEIPAGAARLRISVLEGSRGPVENRAVLKSPMMLVESRK